MRLVDARAGAIEVIVLRQVNARSAVAVVVAGMVAIRTRSVFWTLAVGLPSLWLATGFVSLIVS